MTSKEMSVLFDEYARFNEETTPNTEGTGLGMNIVLSLVRIMDGEITAESEPGQGSVFTLRLPQKNFNAPPIGKETAAQLRLNMTRESESQKITREPMPYGEVLIVDDLENNLLVAAGFMEMYSLTVTKALSAREAIILLEKGNVYDIIFMDYMMPEMDGMEAVRHIRAMGYTAPIVALTANAVVGQSDIFLKNGFDGFISKPISIHTLDTILNKFIRDIKSPNINESDTDISDMHPMLIVSFLKDAEKVENVLKELLHNHGLETPKGIKQFITAVHGIKSILENINEKSSAKLAEELEIAGRDNNIQEIQCTTPVFLQELAIIIKKYESGRSL
jgi:CheY-like chemotaxis protein/HPt (histidine-containing phosphotransfer) domain-containing protein